MSQTLSPYNVNLSPSHLKPANTAYRLTHTSACFSSIQDHMRSDWQSHCHSHLYYQSRCYIYYHTGQNTGNKILSSCFMVWYMYIGFIFFVLGVCQSFLVSGTSSHIHVSRAHSHMSPLLVQGAKIMLDTSPPLDGDGDDLFISSNVLFSLSPRSGNHRHDKRVINEV